MTAIKFWHFGWKMPIWAYFGVFLRGGGFWPLKLWRRCSNLQKNATVAETCALWGITRQNWSWGLVLSCAKEQIKKHRPLTLFSPLRGSHTPEPIDIWAVESCPRRNHPCQMLCKSVKGFLGGSTPKSAISYTFSNYPRKVCTALSCRLRSYVAYDRHLQFAN